MMRCRTPLALLPLLLAAGLTACGTTEEAVEAARWSAPVSASPTAPAPRPAPTSTAQVRKQVAAAMVDLSGFRPETEEITTQSTDAYKLAHPCRDSLPSDRKRTAYRDRQWDEGKIWIRQYVVGYLKVPGRTLIAELRSALAKCTTYKEPDGRTTTVLRPETPLVPESPDTVVWCERIKGKAVDHACTAMVARGNFVMEINASEVGTAELSEKLLTKLYPLALTAFQKAT